MIPHGICQALLHLRYGYGGKELHKQEKKEEEQAERAQHNAKLHPSRAVESPGIRIELMRNGCYYDHIALEPHPYVDEDADNE